MTRGDGGGNEAETQEEQGRWFRDLCLCNDIQPCCEAVVLTKQFEVIPSCDSNEVDALVEVSSNVNRPEVLGSSIGVRVHECAVHPNGSIIVNAAL